jgi:predicted nucleic-acid-binding Zn-ribbon protein
VIKKHIVTTTFQKGKPTTAPMGGVYCPVCEAGVDAVSKFCLSCGNDLTENGPITATGHDLNQLKDVIRIRDDLSMAEKFDLIAKVEEGANPILLGIAAPADDDGDYDVANAEIETPEDKKIHIFGESLAASAAMRAVVRGTDAWMMVQSGDINLDDGLFHDAMKLGMDASTHIHDVASGEHEGVDADAMRAIPVLKPPKRSFCPKCGSDIHESTMLQWRKWRDSSGDVVSMQLEASMQTSLLQVASHYIAMVDELKKELEDKVSDSEIEEKLRERIEKEVRKELEQEFSERDSSDSGAAPAEKPKKKDTPKAAAKSATKPKEKSKQKSQPKKKAGGLFAGKTPKRTFEGDPADKPDWFLSEALDTIYDPHGTGKVLKPKTIVARSSEGNVRVQDIVRDYASLGREGLNELTTTSPLTDYIITAYDSC